MAIVKRAVRIVAFSLAITTVVVVAAQQPSNPTPAPIPAAIFSARKVFISNATGEIPLPQEDLDLAYNEFYASVKNWGRYEIVADPSGTDLIFEIRFHYSVGPTGVTDGNGGSTEAFQLQLTILDSKTHTILWALSKNIPQSHDKIRNRQYFDQTMGALVDGLKKLVSQPSHTSAGQENK